MPSVLTFIIGCTGSGKADLARRLARHARGEIVSIDSMKVYRRMDLGTAKPSIETRREIPHHLIDIAEPAEEFSVAQYVTRAELAIADIRRRGRPIFFVGGTALYIKALTQGLFEGPGADPALRAELHEVVRTQGLEVLHARRQRVDEKAARRIHPNDLRRIVRALEVFELTGKPISELQAQWDRDRTRYDCVFIGVRRGREDQSHRTNGRVRRMIEAGFVDEVKSLLGEPEPLGATARKALGYAEVIRHLDGELSLAEAVELIKINTRHLAKAQRTWFKRFSGTEWIDLTPDEDLSMIVRNLLDRRGSLWTA